MDPLHVDVKSLLKNGPHLYGTMMEKVNSLAPGQGMVVKAPFKPLPLISFMRKKGYEAHVDKAGLFGYTVTFEFKGIPKEEELEAMEALPEKSVTYRLDNRGLFPPEPQLRTLAKLNEMQAGEVLEIHNDRVPVFLFPKLEEQGYPYEVEQLEDGSAKVRIRKK
ncbi:DUF2249 domain-containing protein [Effusibacillus lacus]|uniref:Universal stress protein n=1 Tax=Effusibacillus lacus TaxID=1348429 RepID=A0A292YKG3_9BACL|nr:DUF2249 domain-containing protein [Effusibacillus lacus]TCS75510.1 TusA-related sulfurtransferase [Effusibacillus lacus]GAX88975.1 universal stress protein [Effusibacillus lacus]